MLDTYNSAPGTWTTGCSLHNRFVFVPATEETSRIGPSCGIVN
jgi:hypothetical protein